MAAPAGTPRARQTRDRLIEAAAGVFAERGYRGATMREIAERAGANLAAAHYHFGSKLDLYRDVVRSSSSASRRASPSAAPRWRRCSTLRRHANG